MLACLALPLSLSYSKARLCRTLKQEGIGTKKQVSSREAPRDDRSSSSKVIPGFGRAAVLVFVLT